MHNCYSPVQQLDGIEALLRRSQEVKEEAERLLREARELDQRIDTELQLAIERSTAAG